MIESIIYIVNHIHGSTLHVVFIFFQSALIKLLIISLYATLLYFMILIAKKTFLKNCSIWLHYHVWYVTALCIVFVNCNLNAKISDALSFRVISTSHLTYFLFYIILFIWLVVFVIRVIDNFRISRKICAIIKTAAEYADHAATPATAKSMLCITKPVRIMVSHHIPMPVSYGLFRKYILLPHDYSTRYTHEELLYILLHEYSHIKNGDTVKIRIMNFIVSLLWFNPIIHLLQKRFTFESELLCDHHVLYCDRAWRDAYCDLLIKECSDRRLEGSSLFTEGYLSVKARIESIYSHNHTKRYSGALPNWIFVSLLLANSVFYYAHLNQFALSGSDTAIQIAAFKVDNDSYVDASDYFRDTPCFVDDDTVYIDKRVIMLEADRLIRDGIHMLHFTVEYFTKTSPQLSLVEIGGETIQLDRLADTLDEEEFLRYPINRPNPMQKVFYFLLGYL